MMQGNDSFRLVVRRGPQPNQTYDLNKDIITLGRDITNDIVINDPEVSRHHMRLTRGAGGFTIEDLGSTNGTFVNGQRLTGARPLRNGDMVGLGETVTLGYELISAPAGITGGDPNLPGSTVPSAAQRAPSPAAPANPYAPPVTPQVPQGPGGGFNYSPPPVQPQFSSPAPAPAPPQMAPVQPPGAGYGDYDPYAVREEEPRNTTRWILLGCAGLTVFCCCSSALGLLAVDQLCLWDRLPIVYDVLRALGYTMVCA